MVDITRTTTALLEGLYETSNQDVWVEFDRRYRPIVMAFAHRLGLNAADAADVAQDTLTRFVEEYRAGKYDRSRGRLRSWLIALAKYRVADAYRKKDRRRELNADTAVGHLENDEHLTQIWESERRKAMLRHAMGELKKVSKASGKTIEAFEMLVVNQVPVASVAQELGMSTHDVYLAKSRMASKLRDLIEKIEVTFTEDVG